MIAIRVESPRTLLGLAALAALCSGCSDGSTFSGGGSPPVEPPINVRGGNPLRLLGASETGQVFSVTIEFPKGSGAPNVDAILVGETGPAIESTDGQRTPNTSTQASPSGASERFDAGLGGDAATSGGGFAGGGLTFGTPEPVTLFGSTEIHVEDRASPTADPAAVFSILGIPSGLYAQDDQGDLTLLYATPKGQSIGKGIRLHGSKDQLAGTGQAASAFDDYAYVDKSKNRVFVLEDLDPGPGVAFAPAVEAVLPPGVREVISFAGSPADDDTFFVAYRLIISGIENDFIARVNLDGTLITPNLLGAAKGKPFDMARIDDSLYALSLIGDEDDPVIIDFTTDGVFNSGTVLDPTLPETLGVERLELLVGFPDTVPLQFGVTARGATGIAIVDFSTGGAVQTIDLPEGLTLLDLGRETLPDE